MYEREFKVDRGNLVETWTVGWDHEPTDVEFEIASHPPQLHDVQVGERMRVRRTRGNWWVCLSTGPPTWWMPRFKCKPNRVGFGWLRFALILVRSSSEV
jgi:hypothetical protein